MKNLFYLAFVMIYSLGFTQQEQHFTQYMVNPYTINPGLGGTEDFIDVKLGYRNQWTGFESAPKTYYLTAHSTIGKEFNAGGYHHKSEHKKWHGVGGYIYSDNTGPISRNSYYGQYAYNLALNKHLRLSIGTFIGIKHFSYDLSGLRREDVNDDVLPNTQISQVMPDANVGLWLYNRDWYIGASSFQLLQNKLSIQEFTQLSNADENGKLIAHYFITGGVKLPMSEDFTAVPSFALKGAPNSPLSLDLNIKISYHDQYFGGASFRHGDALSLIAGTVVNEMLDISYSYDLTTSALNKASNGSHEIIIGLRIKHPNHILCASRFW